MTTMTGWIHPQAGPFEGGELCDEVTDAFVWFPGVEA
jgi:hypothetical protein